MKMTHVLNHSQFRIFSRQHPVQNESFKDKRKVQKKFQEKMDTSVSFKNKYFQEIPTEKSPQR